MLTVNRFQSIEILLTLRSGVDAKLALALTLIPASFVFKTSVITIFSSVDFIAPPYLLGTCDLLTVNKGRH